MIKGLAQLCVIGIILLLKKYQKLICLALYLWFAHFYTAFDNLELLIADSVAPAVIALIIKAVIKFRKRKNERNPKSKTT